ncbi:MAG: TetR/AcrR family transcriptional regulator [Marivibrio sp.]|uniref:TetR/AcrR family transcriptional regulator n=1 Tax=Marivibrio sp. TaxID=2039719 RepID=UPI0032EDB56C
MTNDAVQKQDPALTAPPSPFRVAPGRVCYPEALGAAASDAGLRKAERTRLRILAGAAGLLNDADRAPLTMPAAAAAAGVAHGTVYLHFADRPALEAATAEGFAHFLRDHLAQVRDGAPGSEQRVRAATRRYVDLFAANAGLMRCLTQAGERDGPFRRVFHALNRDWNGRVARAMQAQRAAVGAPIGAQEALYAAYALDGMVDEFLAQIHIRRDPALARLRADPEATTELLARLWRAAAKG